MIFRYAVAIAEEDGDFVVSVRDLPEVVTSGDSVEEALALAADAIEVAVVGRMEDEMDLGEPSRARAGEHLVTLPAALAAKAAIYVAWKRARITKSELARRLGLTETEARRILQPRHRTRIDRLGDAAAALDARLVVGIEPRDR